MGEVLQDPGITSRAVEQMAKIYFQEGDTVKALREYTERLAAPRTSKQSAKVFYKMAKCYLHTDSFEFARESALDCVSSAREGGHAHYTLHGTVLCAVCSLKLKENLVAQMHFDNALSLATEMGDLDTAQTVSEALAAMGVQMSLTVGPWHRVPCT